jgi:hypothetical protein
MPFAGSGGRADAGRAIAVRIQSDNDQISRSSAGRVSGKQPPPRFPVLMEGASPAVRDA